MPRNPTPRAIARTWSLTSPTITYVAEFKNTDSDTADSAIAQIKDRSYAEPYRHGPKPVYAIGLAFAPSKTPRPSVCETGNALA